MRGKVARKLASPIPTSDGGGACLCNQERATAEVGDGLWIRAEPVCKLLAPPENGYGKRKATRGVLLDIVEIDFG
jgi:hypothetical protein